MADGYLGDRPGFDLMDIPDVVGRILGAFGGGFNQTAFGQQFPGEPGDLAGADWASGDPATRTFFREGTGRYTPQPFFAPDPTGKIHFFGPMWRPVLWSRDLAATRRVARIARKASRAGGRRRGGR